MREVGVISNYWDRNILDPGHKHTNRKNKGTLLTVFKEAESTNTD